MVIALLYMGFLQGLVGDLLLRQTRARSSEFWSTDLASGSGTREQGGSKRNRPQGYQEAPWHNG